MAETVEGNLLGIEKRMEQGFAQADKAREQNVEPFAKLWSHGELLRIRG